MSRAIAVSEARITVGTTAVRFDAPDHDNGGFGLSGIQPGELVAEEGVNEY